MGFRDLMCFNKAMLAKQCWQPPHNPNFLAASIIKAKYYPHSNIVEAKLGGRSSFAWRSILLACDILKNRLIWRVDDKKDIKIWGDKWILILISYSIQSPRRILEEGTKVWISLIKILNGRGRPI